MDGSVLEEESCMESYNYQGFIQAVLLMSVFEGRLSFWMLYLEKNDHKIIL